MQESRRLAQKSRRARTVASRVPDPPGNADQLLRLANKILNR
jgi:hypothetical protein